MTQRLQFRLHYTPRGAARNYTRQHSGPVLSPANPANDYGGYKGSAANHHYIIQNVVDTLKGRTTASTNALEGLKVVDIIERIYAHKNTLQHV